MNPESLRVLLFSQWKAALTLAPVYMFVRFHLHAELSNGSGSLGWVTRTHTQRHTHTVCSCISSLICCLLSLFPSHEQEPFSQSWMWSSFSKTNLSFSPCSPPPQLFSPQTGTRLFWAFFPIHTGYKCKLMLILMSNQKLQKKKKN